MRQTPLVECVRACLVSFVLANCEICQEYKAWAAVLDGQGGTITGWDFYVVAQLVDCVFDVYEYIKGGNDCPRLSRFNRDSSSETPALYLSPPASSPSISLHTSLPRHRLHEDSSCPSSRLSSSLPSVPSVWRCQNLWYTPITLHHHHIHLR